MSDQLVNSDSNNVQDDLMNRASINIKQLDPDDRKMGDIWDQFVATCPGATFFHKSGW